jgi:hypothetical protein
MSTKENHIWNETADVDNYIWNNWSYSSWDGDGATMRADLTNETGFGIGKWENGKVSINDGSTSIADDLVAHEWGHAVSTKVNWIAGGPKILNEGFADCFSMMVNDDDWLVLDNLLDKRDATTALEFGGFRNFSPGEIHENAHIVSHICHMSVFGRNKPFSSPSQYPCTIPGDCNWYDYSPTTPARTPDEDCIEGQCVSWSNGTFVPYRGPQHGYGPIFKSLTKADGYDGFIRSDSDLFSLHDDLTAAGCTYDDMELSTPGCWLTGFTMYIATFAAGLWSLPTVLFDSTEFLETDKRPAAIERAWDISNPDQNYAAVFFKSLHGPEVYVSYDHNNYEFVHRQELVLDKFNNPLETDAGLSVVKDPPGISGDVLLVFKKWPTDEVWEVIGEITPTGINFGGSSSVEQTQVTGISTDQTPSVVSCNGQLIYVWKDSGSTALWYKKRGSAPTPIDGGTWTANSDKAPAAVCANGRLWVIYKHPTPDPGCGKHLIYWTNSDMGVDPTWLEPITSDCEFYTNWSPEATYYRPADGTKGDGRIWVFYKRPYDASPPPGYFEAEQSQMWSFKPDASGNANDPSTPVQFLRIGTMPPCSGGSCFYSGYQWGSMLRLYYTREDGGVTMIGRSFKLGEG